MKFECGEKQSRGECVAYIDSDGDLNVIPCGSNDKEMKVMCIDKDGWIHTNLAGLLPKETHRFYKGDSVTITF